MEKRSCEKRCSCFALNCKTCGVTFSTTTTSFIWRFWTRINVLVIKVENFPSNRYLKLLRSVYIHEPHNCKKKVLAKPRRNLLCNCFGIETTELLYWFIHRSRLCGRLYTKLKSERLLQVFLRRDEKVQCKELSIE